MEWQETVFKGIPAEFCAVSKSNRLVAVASGCHVIVHLLSNQKRISLDCEAPVVGLNFIESQELVAVTSTGKMIKWSTCTVEMDGDIVFLTSKGITAYPVRFVIWPHSHEESGSLWCIESDNSKDYSCTLALLNNTDTLDTVQVLNHKVERDAVAIGDDFILYCNGPKLSLISTDSEQKFKFSELTRKVKEKRQGHIDKLMEFVRVAAFGNTVAASLAYGEIFVWPNIRADGLDAKKHFVLHWHKISAPMVLTPFGGMLSGGAETVLCKWALEARASPTFLPRLSAAIMSLTLSPDGSHLVAILEDNSISVILVSSMTILANLPSIACGRKETTDVNAFFYSDPHTPGKVVLPGRPGTCLWLDAESGELPLASQRSFSLDNAVDGDMSSVGIIRTYFNVEQLALTSKYIASLETLVNFEDDMKRLRFWQWNGESTQLIDDSRIRKTTRFLKGIDFETTEKDDYIFATTSDFGVIDVYKLHRQNQHFEKDASRSGIQWRNSEVRFVSNISKVDSRHVFATVYDGGAKNDHIVVWNMNNMTICDVIQSNSKVAHINWAKKGLLIYSNETSLNCWNIHTGSRLWTIEKETNCHVDSLGCFAWENEQVVRFDPKSGEILESFSFGSPVRKLISVQTSTSGLVMAFARTETGFAAMLPPASSKPQAEPAPLSKTPFASVESASVSSEKKSAKPPPRPKENPLLLLEGPCHALAPLKQLAPLFIQACLAPPPK